MHEALSLSGADWPRFGASEKGRLPRICFVDKTAFIFHPSILLSMV